MLSCVIVDNGEPNVVKLTFENLYSELKDIPGSELLIQDKWFDTSEIKNRYCCYVEPDCLVSEGYFKKQLENLNDIGYQRQIGIVTAATAVNQWNNKIYGYRIGDREEGIIPNRTKKSNKNHQVQIAYIPGAILRTSMLKVALPEGLYLDDLVYLSTQVSLAFWECGFRIQLNPDNTYVTTEDYVNDINDFNPLVSEKAKALFSRESI